jgi:predicted unusual protein kinase regulating ubiquinone biosynthesis (AarF/ABC1/UbiB family)
MRRSRVAIAGALLVGAAAVGAAVGASRVIDDDRKELARRQLRVWRLTARRGAHWATVKVRGATMDDERRAQLEEQFAIKTAEDVAQELGNMKGAIMKLGQMVSFIADGLPDDARIALQSLLQDVPPMAPSLAAQVVREQLGDDPERVFLEWDPVPVAAASIGQVHKAVAHDGRVVAVKVQYPGVGTAIKHDLDNAEMLYSMFAAVSLKGLDVHALVDELRARMYDELDYYLEAACQTEFFERYRGHPFIRIPEVVPELSAEKVLTTEWIDGAGWGEFEATASEAERQHAAEVVFRFAQGSVHRHGVFNGDPHPGNYRFHDDGRVTFFDFGLVKRWQPEELARLMPILDFVLDRDVTGTVAAMERVGFIRADHTLDPERVFECVSAPYRAYFEDEYTFTKSYTTEALRNVMDLQGPYADVIKNLNMPPSFVILDRVVWGVSALLGRLEARNKWRGILQEYRHGDPPVTPLGEAEAEWARARAALAS